MFAFLLKYREKNKNGEKNNRTIKKFLNEESWAPIFEKETNVFIVSLSQKNK